VGAHDGHRGAVPVARAQGGVTCDARACAPAFDAIDRLAKTAPSNTTFLTLRFGTTTSSSFAHGPLHKRRLRHFDVTASAEGFRYRSFFPTSRLPAG